MTSLGNRAQPSTALRVDGLPLLDLADNASERIAIQQVKRRFWASGQSPVGSRRREVMEVNLGTRRLVNNISFQVSRFPLVLRAEYLDENGDWQIITHMEPKVWRRGKKRKPRKTLVRRQARLTIAESVPRRVNSAQAKGHPQHFGKAHWLSETWRVNPVVTRKIRFIFQRNDQGNPPRNRNGQKVAYSVAMKDLTIGYRVLAPEDVPRTQEPWWASSSNIVGSQVVYSTYTQDADRAVDGSLETYWRSEPQPFPFAVVNMYLDLLDSEGVAPVVDRFWVDPVTTGVHCNIYYSDSIPEGDFEGISAPIPAAHYQEVGGPLLVRDPVSLRPTAITLGPSAQAGVQVTQHYTRLRYDRPWWVGIDASSVVDTTDTQQRPIISLGSTQVLQEGTELKVITPNGDAAVINLDPEKHGRNTRHRIVIAHFPRSQDRLPYLRIAYSIGGHFPVEADEIAIKPLLDLPVPVRIGLHPDPLDDSQPAITIHGLVVKNEALTPEAEDWFVEEGEEFVSDAYTEHDDRGTSQNAVIRMHPDFISEGNLFGVVGGSGDRYDEMEWTPILRDYTLRQGYMHLPPTRAAYWKFEMTGLMPQVYENFIPFERDALVFPPDIVRAYQQANGLADEAGAPPGVNATASMAQQVAYTDALAAEKRPLPPPNATEALVIRDPVQAQQIRDSGWIWQYQPWHVGNGAPKFMTKQIHRYENVRVRHATKVSYFAGIREIRPFRLDYTFDDDTPEYVEHMLDTAFLDLEQTSGVEHFEGGIRSTSVSGEITSSPLTSYRTVRGVQFATQETDAVQVLTDPDFIASHLDFWKAYGDADLDRLGPNDLLVNRGWFANTYGDLESLYATYGDMDDVPYALLEGNNFASGSAEGGVTSEHYSPTGAGKITGQVTLSGQGTMNAPVIVEIVSAYDDRVLASTRQVLQAGETRTVSVGYAPGSLVERQTYGDLETLVSDPTTYAELEAYRYYELEREDGILTDVYLRVRQQAPTDDSFHVHRMGLYDSPIAWFFSNDDGETWWQAIDVKNNPHGVLIFPPSDTPEEPGTGRTLRWRARIFSENATINALHIRPWYGTRDRTTARSHGLESLGPNYSMRDQFPATHQHPMWQPRFNPLEKIYVEPEPPVTFWRNLSINPGAEYASPAGETPGGGADIVIGEILSADDTPSVTGGEFGPVTEQPSVLSDGSDDTYVSLTTIDGGVRSDNVEVVFDVSAIDPEPESLTFTVRARYNPDETDEVGVGESPYVGLILNLWDYDSNVELSTVLSARVVEEHEMLDTIQTWTWTIDQALFDEDTMTSVWYRWPEALDFATFRDAFLVDPRLYLGVELFGDITQGTIDVYEASLSVDTGDGSESGTSTVHGWSAEGGTIEVVELPEAGA